MVYPVFWLQDLFKNALNSPLSWSLVDGYQDLAKMVSEVTTPSFLADGSGDLV